MSTADEFEKAKCVIEAWDINDPDLSHIKPGARQGWAQKMCDGCPVMALCAQQALAFGASGTVMAGTCIPEHVYGNDQAWLHQLHIISETGEIPSPEDVQAHLAFVEIPKYTMNATSALGRHTLRQGETCHKGHDLVESNIYNPPGRPGTRECRKCIKVRHAARRKGIA